MPGALWQGSRTGAGTDHERRADGPTSTLNGDAAAHLAEYQITMACLMSQRRIQESYGVCYPDRRRRIADGGAGDEIRPWQTSDAFRQSLRGILPIVRDFAMSLCQDESCHRMGWMHLRRKLEEE